MEYLNLRERTFDSDQMLQAAWSSGERTLISVAASLWNTGAVDLGYIACALGGRHLQAVLDATAIRAGHDLASNVDLAIARFGASSRPGSGQSQSRARGPRPSFDVNPVTPVQDRPCLGVGR